MTTQLTNSKEILMSIVKEFELVKQLFQLQGWNVTRKPNNTYTIYSEVDFEAEDLIAEDVCLAHVYYEYSLLMGIIDLDQYDRLVDEMQG